MNLVHQYLVETIVDEQILMEKPEAGYYFHISAYQNFESIMKNGLIPNFNGGNYDEDQWVSLEGVYASRNVDHLRNIMFSQDISFYTLVIVYVGHDEALPDEDIIENNLSDVYHKLKDEFGYQWVDLRNLSPSLRKQFWGEVEKRFDTIAGGDGNIPDFVEKLVDLWSKFIVYNNTKEIRDEWKTVKDQTVRYYHNMKHSRYGMHSVRVPQKIGFSGNSKIVGIVRIDNTARLMYGEIPKEISNLFTELTEYRIADVKVQK